MSRLAIAARICGGLALLADAGPALAQGGAGAAGGMRGQMGGGIMSPYRVEQLRRSIPEYDAAADYARALEALKASRFREAARLAERVTEGVPTNPTGWRLLGVAYAGDNNWKGSRRAYQRAVKLAPDDLTVHAGLGLAMANLGDPRAREQLDWLRARASVCGDTCPDAVHLQNSCATVESALWAPAIAAAAPG